MIDMLIINNNGILPELMQVYMPAAAIERAKWQKSFHTSLFAVNSTRRRLRADAVSATPEPGANSSDWLSKLSDRDWESRVARDGHCSAFVRLASSNRDLLVGHNTWNDYSKMTRVFKYYHFHLPDSWQVAASMGFSSYPGCVSSTDDFYMLSSGLAVMDTSLEVLNPEVYKQVPQFPNNPHIPNFMEIQILNRMARTAAHWVSLYSERNSGVGNAQWIIVDYNIFVPGKPLPDNSVYVLEQIPGEMHKGDVSEYIRSHGYWASYDRPFFPEIRERAGHTAAETKYGDLYSYSRNPRAQIFAGTGAVVEKFFDMRTVMMRNQWPNEGVLPNDPGHAISGPSHETQSPFMWKDASGKDLFPGWPHLGLPEKWDFDWLQMTPSGQHQHLQDISDCHSPEPPGGSWGSDPKR